jgi:RNA polymerase sigma-70 factor (ECF subfamily)
MGRNLFPVPVEDDFHMNSPDSDASDGELIARILAGEVNGFEVLLERYEQFVFGIVRKHGPQARAGEIAQDVFVAAYKALPTFRGTADFKCWLGRIAVRQCCNYWREHYRDPVDTLSDLNADGEEWRAWADRAAAVESLEREDDRRQARELLEHGLRQLEPEERLALTLMYLDGHSVKEIAALTGWSAMNVKVRAFRARRRLRKALERVISREAKSSNMALPSTDKECVNQAP